MNSVTSVSLWFAIGAAMAGGALKAQWQDWPQFLGPNRLQEPVRDARRLQHFPGRSRRPRGAADRRDRR